MNGLNYQIEILNELIFIPSAKPPRPDSIPQNIEYFAFLSD